MKCFVKDCPSEIDELKEFPVTYGPKGVTEDHVEGQRAHSAELERWRFVLICERGNGDTELASGHVCPGHAGGPFALVAGKGA